MSKNDEQKSFTSAPINWYIQTNVKPLANPYK